ncbi:MAG: SDR family oxidoreductase [Hyphomicrobiaceae bacterium]|nr:MAG: SDR family oxidoreductase [Hyphomicrobiaceae bacterium]
MRRFEGRAAFITAAARAIGLAAARRLALEGARVAIADRDEAALRQVAGEMKSAGLAVVPIVMDSMDAPSTADGFARAVSDVGPIDILVNNAGGSLHTPQHFLEESDGDWDSVMQLNLSAAVRASRAVLPGMIERRYGRIINLGSKAGRFGSLFAGANYAAAKGAVQAMTRQLAMEYGPHGITVNCVAPGLILTERTRGFYASRRSEDERARTLAEIPVRRHGEVEDVAAAIAFLASEEAAFITGVTLDVNGGQVMA